MEVKSMDAKELYGYRMTSLETSKWLALQNQIMCDCQFLQISSQFKEIIEKKSSAKESYLHEAGYHEKAGYYYISIGDYGEPALKCLSHDPNNMRWYVLEEIVTYVGQEQERKTRRTEEQNWRYTRDFKDGKPAYVENERWIYNTIYDTRKFWFEYAINSLYKVFGASRLYPYVSEHIGLMNQWFVQPHWDFDWQKMCFVEISDSQEHD
jgi:hypothetical protein